MVWMTGGALILCIVMIVSLLALVLVNGMGTFWPEPLPQFTVLGDPVDWPVADAPEASRGLALNASLVIDNPDAATSDIKARQFTRVASFSTLRDDPDDPSPEGKLAIEEPIAWFKVPATLRTLAPGARLTRDGVVWARGEDVIQERPIRHVMGEFNRTDRYTPDDTLVAKLTPAWQDRMAARTGTQRGVQRQMFRTGNFELTNEHFTWISEPQVLAQDRPAWALTIERQEWGRFYGTLHAYSINTPRPIGDEEVRLASSLNFLREMASTQQRNARLGEQLAEAKEKLLAAPQKERPALTEQIEMLTLRQTASDLPRVRELFTAGPLAQPTLIDSLQTDLVKVQAQAVQTFRERYLLPPEATARAVTSAGKKPLAELVPGEDLLAIASVWTDPAQAWAHFQHDFPQVTKRRLERAALEDNALGDQINDARLSLRDLEIAQNLEILRLLEGRRLALLRLADLEQPLTDARTFVRDSLALAGRESALHQAALALETAVAADLTPRTQAVRDEIAQFDAQQSQLPAPVQSAIAEYEKVRTDTDRAYALLQKDIQAKNRENDRYDMELLTTTGRVKALPVAQVVRTYRGNALSWSDKVGIYLSRWWEFLTDEPREANQEGGVFPAIFGTVLMTLIMSIAVVPFGVLAALYLREYAKPGPIVSMVRIAVNNLAGVPSIVFGVFGLGFFIYGVGRFVDAGTTLPMPPIAWVILVVLSLAGFVLTCLISIHNARLAAKREKNAWWLGGGTLLWIVVIGAAVLAIVTCPYFHGYYRTNLPNPTFGKGGVLWASFTLALLTLPVVIVATEEALAAVPSSMREGSYACGASKWQTIQRIVLPRALPGIMTGMSLAMARGAGEVAPLMLVGAVKLAPELPVQMAPPFGMNQSFMHLGFHIYDLGFQSQNSEAAKPMVFTTTLLLIALVGLLNLSAIWLRTRLRRRYVSAAF